MPMQTLTGKLLTSAALMLEGRPAGIKKRQLIDALRTTAIRYEVTRSISNAPSASADDTVESILCDAIEQASNAGVDWWTGDDQQNVEIDQALLALQNELVSELAMRIKQASSS